LSVRAKDAVVIDPLVDAFGPFLVPVVAFFGGVIGYAILVALSRLR